MAVAPSEFPPPFDSADVIVAPTDPADERIEVGVAIVGGGPAGLACANKLMQLLENEPELTEKLGEVPVAVIEKGKVAGAHLLSGANVDPSALEQLFPDLSPAEWPPVYQEVTKDATYFLTSKKAFPLKPPPPNFRKEGTYTLSVSKLGRFLAEKAEEAGVYILTETAATKLLVEDRIVRGVRSGDRGRGKDGEELGNFEPGSDVVAKATVLAEGTIGHLTYAAYDYFDMHGSDPQAWELGVKEVWEVPKPLDRVIHTLGWPLRWGPRYKEAGGSFIYPMGEDKVCFGLVVGLDYHRRDLQRPRRAAAVQDAPVHQEDPRGRQAGRLGREDDPVRRLLGAARSASRCPACWSPATAPGWSTSPNSPGVHYAMHAGMYAAETIVDALKQDIDSVNFESYDGKIRNSVIEKDLYRSRNMKQPLTKGLIFGGAMGSAMVATKGAFPGGHWKVEDNADARSRSARRPTSTRSPTTSSPSTSSTRSSSRATRPATTRRTTSGSRPGCRARWPRPGSRCARRRSTRSPTTSSRTAPGRSTST